MKIYLLSPLRHRVALEVIQRTKAIHPKLWMSCFVFIHFLSFILVITESSASLQNLGTTIEIQNKKKPMLCSQRDVCTGHSRKLLPRHWDKSLHQCFSYSREIFSTPKTYWNKWLRKRRTILPRKCPLLSSCPHPSLLCSYIWAERGLGSVVWPGSVLA